MKSCKSLPKKRNAQQAHGTGEKVLKSGERTLTHTASAAEHKITGFALLRAQPLGPHKASAFPTQRQVTHGAVNAAQSSDPKQREQLSHEQLMAHVVNTSAHLPAGGRAGKFQNQPLRQGAITAGPNLPHARVQPSTHVSPPTAGIAANPSQAAYFQPRERRHRGPGCKASAERNPRLLSAPHRLE